MAPGLDRQGGGDSAHARPGGHNTADVGGSNRTFYVVCQKKMDTPYIYIYNDMYI